MRCIFCNKEIIPKSIHKNAPYSQPITLPGRGIAHINCAERDLIERRVFGSINMVDLPINDLYELRELVLAEINARERMDDNEVDLF